MKTKGRRRSKNIDDRRQTGMAAPLWQDWPMDATFRGSVDQMMRTGTQGILPYMLGVPEAKSLYEVPNYRIQKQSPRPRPNPKRRQRTIAQGG